MVLSFYHENDFDAVLTQKVRSNVLRTKDIKIFHKKGDIIKIFCVVLRGVLLANLLSENA